MSAPSDPDWRTQHCAELAALAVREASGRDIWAELGGCPRSWREAADLYRRIGVRTLAGAVTAVLGPPLADKRLARRGDVVIVRGALGIVRGELIECMGANVPLSEATSAWRAD